MQSLAGEIKLDFRSDEPIYIQIVSQIQDLVAVGRLKEGDQLPTVRQLATELRVNFNTIARAYRILDESGLISTQRGRGTYIWEQPTDDTARALRRDSLEALAIKFLEDAQRLGVTRSEAFAALQEHIQNREIAGDSTGETPNPKEM